MPSAYQRARKQGLRELRRDTAAGRYPYPPALDDILKGRGSQGEVPVGLVELDLDLIAGTRTRGRQNGFSRGFMPLLDPASEFAAKWSALFESQLSEGFREPITVFEYDQRFYVQEGNKRVSVARYVGAPSILARVTRVVPMAGDDDAWASYTAFAAFYRVCPLYGIAFSDPSSFAELAELSGHDLVDPWPEDDVLALKALLHRFTASFRSRGGGSLPLPQGDALLIFLRVMGYDRSIALTAAEVDQALGSLWGEMVLAARGEDPVFLEAPAPAAPAISELAGIARDMARQDPFRVAFIYNEDPARSGWVALHEEGRCELERRLGATVATEALVVSTCEPAFGEAASAAVAHGADLVVTVQPTQMEATLRAALAHPGTTFLNCSAIPRGAVRTFSCRLYEVKFLMGMAAAAMARNHRIGYVAESPVMSTVAEVNAFAIGAAMVDPFARVHLAWRSERSYDWRRTLVEDAGASVVCGRDSADPADPGRPWGLFAVRGDGGQLPLARPVWRWGRYYELMVRSIRGAAWRRDGRANPNQALDYWWGLSSGVVDIELDRAVPEGVRELIEALRQSVMSHRLDPFAGELVSQEAHVQQTGAPRMAAADIVGMSWLNWNVVGRLPAPGDLSDASREQVRVAGILPPRPIEGGAR